MAEIEFFAIEEEIVELVRWLLDRHCELVPDCHYESSSAARITELLEIQRLAESTPHFFVIRQDLVESPLSLREVTTADRHFFYIDPRTGGPTLQFYWGRQFEREERQHLSATWLSSYSWYEDSLSGERKKPPSALLALYSEFAKAVRAGRRKIKPGKRDFWVSPHVEDLVRAGIVLVGLEGMPVDQILSAAHS
jgi:hypothetical protein